MAKSAAALHILVKEEKLALEILAKLERGADESPNDFGKNH